MKNIFTCMWMHTPNTILLIFECPNATQVNLMMIGPLRTKYFHDYNDDIHMRNKIALLVCEVMGEDDYDTGLGYEVIDDDNISMDYEVDENKYCHDSEGLDDGCISSNDEGFEFENEDY